MSQFGQRILILVPHPDDEVVACAATIKRAQNHGAQIFALYLTNGCIAREMLWPWQRKTFFARVARRREEALSVALNLGIIPTGFADRPARSLWQQFPDVLHEIHAAIERHQIDQMWVPAYEGGNADHDGLNGLVGQLLAHSIPTLEFAEYNYKGGRVQAQTFPDPDATQTLVLLTPEEQVAKRTLLRFYASEKNNLGYVGTTQECYRPLAGHDYSKPPHEGRLWYTRFHWVPFRHPRIDFTKPREVCAALASLRASASDLPEPARQSGPEHKE